MAEIIQINEKTWRIEDDMVRFFLFCGETKAALIDTGMNVPDAKKIAEKITSLPLILINTHADRDHISGNGAFDEIYAMHGTFSVAPTIIPKLLDGAQQILDGKASGSPVNIFGNEVLLYQFDFAGFLCAK